ncbi:MAG: hypothetical protein ACLS7X_05175 [Mediterraneibacter gnavus]
MARPRKYVIKLTDDELKTLKSIIRKSNTSKTIRSRCQIIIDLDEAHGKVLTHEQSAKIKWCLPDNCNEYSDQIFFRWH